MTAEIDALDRALARVGEDVVLRRVTSGSNVDVTCRARVRSPAVQEIAAGYQQDDSLVILSPTQILAAGWPGDGSMIRGGGPNGDQVKIAGRFRRVELADNIKVGGVWVRSNLRVVG